MIEIILSIKCAMKLERELRNAGDSEIGGVLAAEQIAESKFIVRALSVQRNGSSTSFVRDPNYHRKFMRRFHRLTGNQPQRFNYLGEWHSHPNFLALPSKPDLVAMDKEIHDIEQTASFLVLVIVKLAKNAELVGSAHAFRREQSVIRATLKTEPGASIKEERAIVAASPLSILRRLFR